MHQIHNWTILFEKCDCDPGFTKWHVNFCTFLEVDWAHAPIMTLHRLSISIVRD